MADTTEVKKYLFDLTFDDPMESDEPKPEPPPLFSQEQLDQAKKDSYDQGLAAGKAAAQESQQNYANRLLAEIDDKLLDIQKTAGQTWQSQLAEMNEVALVIAKKILPHYVERYGLGEIAALTEKVINDMSREPRLVIRVGEANFEEAKTLIEQLAADKAYEGKVVILGDAALGVADCRIEWADGGVERDVPALWEAIDGVLKTTQKPLEPSAAAQTAETQEKPEEIPQTPPNEVGA